jgi:hypothetical protein
MHAKKKRIFTQRGQRNKEMVALISLQYYLDAVITVF